MNLHDATLVSIALDWASGQARLLVRPVSWGDDTPAAVEVVCTGVSRIEVPRLHPWGASVSINQVSVAPGRVEVGMQSGDVIVVEAEEIAVP